MKDLLLLPNGWPCKYKECPPGLFLYEDTVCMKTEYGDEGFNSAGETFCKTDDCVQPLKAVWVESE